MGFKIDDALGNVKDAMKGEMEDDNGWDDIEDYWEQILEDRKDAIRIIGDLRLQGVLDNDDVAYELDQERKTLEIQALAVKQMTKALIQRMLNAEMESLRKTILDLV